METTYITDKDEVKFPNFCQNAATFLKSMQGSNFSSHTRKMRVKKAISEVVFSLLAFFREWKFQFFSFFL